MYTFTKRQAHKTLKIWLNINTKKEEKRILPTRKLCFPMPKHRLQEKAKLPYISGLQQQALGSRVEDLYQENSVWPKNA